MKETEPTAAEGVITLAELASYANESEVGNPEAAARALETAQKAFENPDVTGLLVSDEDGMVYEVRRGGQRAW